METQPQTAANVKQAVPFFMVEDMQKSVRFYVDGLGFEITHRWEQDGNLRWCMMRLGDSALMLQEFHPSRRPDGKVGQGVSICFVCEDALAIYRDIKARGIESKTPFVGNAMWVVSVSDPDGYRLDFESNTDLPEETVLSE